MTNRAAGGPELTNRSIALLVLAGLTVILAGPEAARWAQSGDWGGGVGVLVAPFLVFVLSNLVIYVLARLVHAPGRVTDFRRTRLNYAGLMAALLALLATAAQRSSGG